MKKIKTQSKKNPSHKGASKKPTSAALPSYVPEKNRVCDPGYALPPPNANNSWEAEEIVYGKIALSSDTSGTFQLRYDVGTPRVVPTTDIDIEDYVQDLLDKRPTQAWDALLDPEAPLSLPITNDCYVVLELSTKVKWQFRCPDAVTMKSDQADRYFDLRHITDTAGRFCIVYFSARVRDMSEMGNTDPANLHIEFFQPNGSKLQICIDPDIQNPGKPPDSAPI